MRTLQVSEFLAIVNDVLRATFSGEAFAVEGEVSGYRVSQGQWVSFDLKDEKSLVNIFLPVWQLTVPIEDGIRVRVYGLPRIYPKYGKFSLSAERIELAGEGALKKAFALLRQRLEREGLFDPSRKRPLPRFPSKIALVASKESAAYGDFIRVLGERWRGLDIDLHHVIVQGERAPSEIVKAIQEAQLTFHDVLVLTRGGGSMEELMAFNDERVVRAIHASKIPTLVAIGHERDVTFAEEAADVRGSTPTDCARRLVPDRRDVLYELATTLEHIESALEHHVERGESVIRRAVHSASHWIEALVHRFDACARLLASLDPSAVLRRGYAMVRSSSGRLVTHVAGVSLGASVNVTLHDGRFDAEVTDVAKFSTMKGRV
ncbi:MAG: exodeoxyribonuclease VII large subunit [Patescibacteria group bacterium]